MSTKAISEALDRLRLLERCGDGDFESIDAAEAEVEAIHKAAKDLTRLHVGDGASEVAHREHVIAAMTTPESQWFHPDVIAWGEASEVLRKIAEEAK